MKTAQDVLKAIKDQDIKYVDFRFTDPRGKWQHVTFDVSIVDEDAFADGVMFDGSSIAGWKAINESDMTLMPDPETACMDPFFSASTMSIVCDVLEPATGEPYARDPRGVAKKAEAYLKSTGIGDAIFVGPEAEFFVFDDVRFKADPYNTGFIVDSIELPSNQDTVYEGGNLGHRIRTKGGYFPVPPLDSAQDMRGEMLAAMASMGVKVEKHHHEVASAQHELGMKFDKLTLMADGMQIYKYCIHQVAQSYGKTATFMPKPVFGDNGSGMHVHQSIWKDGKPVFAGDKYADLSQECLWYIGGIIKHAKSLNAFTNPSTNSYKRLVPGYEAPVLARLFGAQSLGLLPHPLHGEPEGQARRSPLSRPGREPLSRLRGHADGGARRDHQQARSGRRHGQGSLRSAETGTGSDPDCLRLVARSAREPEGRPRLPDDRRRLHRRLDRILHRAQDDRSDAFRNDASSRRIRDVLLGLTYCMSYGRRSLDRPPSGCHHGADRRIGAGSAAVRTATQFKYVKAQSADSLIGLHAKPSRAAAESLEHSAFSDLDKLGCQTKSPLDIAFGRAVFGKFDACCAVPMAINQ